MNAPWLSESLTPQREINDSPLWFPIEFARQVTEILKREKEIIKNWTYNTSNPHPVYGNCKLFAWLDFTHDEVHILANTESYYDWIWIEWIPDWIDYDEINWTCTVPEIKIIRDSQLHKNNPNLKSVKLKFTYHFTQRDTYIWWVPKFEKTLYYLDYRK